MPIRDILPGSGVKQGLFTARPTPRLEYEVADARNNSLTPPGNVSGSTHPHLRGNERNSRSPPSHHYEASYDVRCATPRTNSLPVEGGISAYIPPSASRTEESTTHCETKPPETPKQPRKLSCPVYANSPYSNSSTLPPILLHSRNFTTCSLRSLVA